MRNETYINALIRLQHLSWYLIAVYFGFMTLLLFLKVELANTAIRGGVGLVLTVATLRLVIIAMQFRAGKLRKFELLSYTLMAMLILIVLAKLFL
jgi:hypothetical protein